MSKTLEIGAEESSQTIQKGGSSRARARGDSAGGAESQEGIGPLAVVVGDPAKAVMEALAGKFTPEVLCAKLEALMKFEKVYIDRNGREIRSPEGSVQLKATETIIAYLVGRPVERQQIITHSQPATMDDLLEKAKKSPVFRQTLRQLLDGLDSAIEVA